MGRVRYIQAAGGTVYDAIVPSARAADRNGFHHMVTGCTRRGLGAVSEEKTCGEANNDGNYKPALITDHDLVLLGENGFHVY
jgi:hypothetical protein